MAFSPAMKGATLKSHQGYPHGMCAMHADPINPYPLAFIRE
jgi:non-heme chloroperoxidase